MYERITKEVDDYKKIVFTTAPELLFLAGITAQKLADDYNLAETKDVARLFGLKVSGREIEVATRVVNYYQELLNE